MSRCELRVGRLIDRPCGRGRTAPCGSCGRQVCQRHYEISRHQCAACAGSLPESTAGTRIEDLGDPMEFAPEIFAAFVRRAGAPQDELAGVDS